MSPIILPKSLLISSQTQFALRNDASEQPYSLVQPDYTPSSMSNSQTNIPSKASEKPTNAHNISYTISSNHRAHSQLLQASRDSCLIIQSLSNLKARNANSNIQLAKFMCTFLRVCTSIIHNAQSISLEPVVSAAASTSLSISSLFGSSPNQSLNSNNIQLRLCSPSFIISVLTNTIRENFYSVLPYQEFTPEDVVNQAQKMQHLSILSMCLSVFFKVISFLPPNTAASLDLTLRTQNTNNHSIHDSLAQTALFGSSLQNTQSSTDESSSDKSDFTDFADAFIADTLRHSPVKYVSSISPSHFTNKVIIRHPLFVSRLELISVLLSTPSLSQLLLQHTTLAGLFLATTEKYSLKSDSILFHSNIQLDNSRMGKYIEVIVLTSLQIVDYLLAFIEMQEQVQPSTTASNSSLPISNQHTSYTSSVPTGDSSLVLTLSTQKQKSSFPVKIDGSMFLKLLLSFSVTLNNIPREKSEMVSSSSQDSKDPNSLKMNDSQTKMDSQKSIKVSWMSLILSFIISNYNSSITTVSLNILTKLFRITATFKEMPSILTLFSQSLPHSNTSTSHPLSQQTSHSLVSHSSPSAVWIHIIPALRDKLVSLAFNPETSVASLSLVYEFLSTVVEYHPAVADSLFDVEKISKQIPANYPQSSNQDDQHFSDIIKTTPLLDLFSTYFSDSIKASDFSIRDLYHLLGVLLVVKKLWERRKRYPEIVTLLSHSPSFWPAIQHFGKGFPVITEHTNTEQADSSSQEKTTLNETLQ